MQAQTLQVGSQTINYYDNQNSGPAIVLIHGNSASGRAYQKQFDSALSQRYRLVALDLPGHGQSSPAADPQTIYSLPGYAKVIVAMAEQLSLTEAVFVGWSLGGHIVLEMTDQLPDAAGFLIFGTPPLGFPPAMAEAFLPHPAMAHGFQSALSEAEMDICVRALFKAGVTDLPLSFQEDFRLTDGTAREKVGGSLGPGGYKDEVEIVQNLKQPLAILHGEQEQLINGAYISGLTMPTLWRGVVQRIPDAGHAPQWEQPERFNQLLEAFVKEVQ